MARKRTPRGRQAPRLPALRVSDAELQWAMREVERTGKSLTQLQRDRFFASMPGYKS